MRDSRVFAYLSFAMSTPRPLPLPRSILLRHIPTCLSFSLSGTASNRFPLNLVHLASMLICSLGAFLPPPTPYQQGIQYRDSDGNNSLTDRVEKELR